VTGWRTADVRWWALLVGVVVFASAVVGLASAGAAGIASAAVLVAAAVGLVLVWSNAPFDQRHETPTE
jgi:hypothetical protein